MKDYKNKRLDFCLWIKNINRIQKKNMGISAKIAQQHKSQRTGNLQAWVSSKLHTKQNRTYKRKSYFYKWVWTQAREVQHRTNTWEFLSSWKAYITTHLPNSQSIWRNKNNPHNYCNQSWRKEKENQIQQQKQTISKEKSYLSAEFSPEETVIVLQAVKKIFHYFLSRNWISRGGCWRENHREGDGECE